MAKLTRTERARHGAALERLEQETLTADDKEFVFDNFHEGANHINGDNGAFFTPLELAWDVSIDASVGSIGRPARYLDLCSGIGVLAYVLSVRYPGSEIHCVEIDPDYISIGERPVPEATWHLLDAMDHVALAEMGKFDLAVSNPPFGKVKSFKGKAGVRYTGGEAEYKAIDMASTVSDNGLFIIPQQSAGFRYSGVQNYSRDVSDKYLKFSQGTGLTLDIGMAIDTSFYSDGWKGVKPTVEVVNIDFLNCDMTGEQATLF